VYFPRSLGLVVPMGTLLLLRFPYELPVGAEAAGVVLDVEGLVEDAADFAGELGSSPKPIVRDPSQETLRSLWELAG
jgi:hypothetical protein